jgi:hypothetical protein
MAVFLEHESHDPGKVTGVGHEISPILGANRAVDVLCPLTVKGRRTVRRWGCGPPAASILKRFQP